MSPFRCFFHDGKSCSGDSSIVVAHMAERQTVSDFLNSETRCSDRFGVKSVPADATCDSSLSFFPRTVRPHRRISVRHRKLEFIYLTNQPVQTRQPNVSETNIKDLVLIKSHIKVFNHFSLLP